MKRHIFGKLAIAAMAMGFLSPSLQVKKDITEGASIDIGISLFHSAEAAPVHRQARRVSRRTSRRTSRRVNYRHNAGRYYGGSYYRPPVGAAVVAGAVTGLAIGSIVASIPPSCSVVRVGGVEYRNCSGTYYQPVYQGSTVSYKVVPAPY